MVRGHDKDEWNRTSALCAAAYNASGMIKRQVLPSAFNPYAEGNSDGGKGGMTQGVKKVSFKQFVKGFDTERKHG